MRFALMVALLVVAGCSGGGDKGGGAGSGSCQQIRLCALDCNDDACVANSCKPKGSTEAQAAFQALYDCTKTVGQCATPNDLNCICPAQCIQDPPCGPELDTCVGATSDSICDINCH